MEKMTRVKKYKDLRESMKEEVSIERQAIEDVVEDDDFLNFIPKKEETVSVDDTLMNPLSYETLDETAQHVKDALNMAKRNVGKNQYNTRLDILSKIKNEDKNEEDLKDVDISNGYVVNQKQKKMSLLEKLATMSPEEDVKELEKYEKEQKEKRIKEKKEEIIEETEELKLFTELMEEDEEESEEDTENNNKLLTALNSIIIILIIVFICFIGVFAYQLFF